MAGTPYLHRQVLTAARYLAGDGAPLFVNRTGVAPINIGLHEHEFLEIGMVVDGNGWHHHMRGATPLAAGDVYAIMPGQWHGHEAGRGLELANVCLSLDLLRQVVPWHQSEPLLATVLTAPMDQHLLAFRIDEEALTTIERHHTRLLTLRAQDKRSACRTEELGVLVALLGILAQAFPGQPSIAERDPLIAGVISRLSADIARPWGLEEIAASAELSEAHLVRRFRAITGASPIAWLIARRIEEGARLLLTSDRPVGDIAVAVGMSDANYFGRRFRVETGVSPSDFRAGIRRGNLG